MPKFKLLSQPKMIEKTLRHDENCRHIADSIFKFIFFKENVCILMQIWFKFVKIVNKLALVHVQVWQPTGDKPLPEWMSTKFSDTILHH